MGIPTPQLITSINEQNKNKQHQGLFVAPTQQLSNLAKTQKWSEIMPIQLFNLDNIGYKISPITYQPQSNLRDIGVHYVNSLLSSPQTAEGSNLFSYTPYAPQTNIVNPIIPKTNLSNIGGISTKEITAQAEQIKTPENNLKNVSLFKIPSTKLGEIGDIDKKGIMGQASNIQTPNINLPTVTFSPISKIKIPDIGDISTKGITAQAGQTTFQPNIQAGQIANYFNPAQLRQDIYSGMRSNILDERETAFKRLQETMAKTGLYRSGLTLANQQELEKNTLKALSQAWGQAALQVANLQIDIAKTQAALDTQTNIRNAELKADLDKFNAQLRTQTDLANARNLLEKKIAEYDAKKQIAIEQGRMDLSAEFENAKNNLQTQLVNLQAKEHQYQIESDLAKTQASLETQTSLANAQNLLQSKIAEYESKRQMAIEQGRLDQAREFENAKNNLQAQLANLQASMRQFEIQSDLAKTQAQLTTETNLANAQNLLQSKIAEYESKRQMAIEQGRLDQAREFERAQNSLQAQLASLQANLNIYGVQSEQAKAQAILDQEISKFNAEIQQSVKTHAFDKLLEVSAIDQDAINKAQQFNVTIKNAYDELAFKWAASLLDQEIREYAAKLDLIAKAQAANAQYGTQAAKTQWNTLAYQYAQP